MYNAWFKKYRHTSHSPWSSPMFDKASCRYTWPPLSFHQQTKFSQLSAHELKPIYPINLALSLLLTQSQGILSLRLTNQLLCFT